MKWKVVVIVALLGALAWPGPGHAEKVKANQSTKLFSRAGEQSPVVLKLKAGQSMTVLSKDGRWLKVRVSGRTGWIPRSKVDMPNDDDEVARNTRRRPFVDGRGTKRGFGGEGGPDDRIGADATGDAEEPARPARGGKEAKGKEARGKEAKGGDDGDGDGDEPARGGKGGGKDSGDDADEVDAKEPARPMAHVAKATDIYNDPDAKSGTSFTAQPRTALYIGEEKGKWTFVENDEGEAGFVLTSKLDVETPAAGGPRARMIALRGGLGLAPVIRQSVSTAGGPAAVPDNYTAGSSSVVIALGASALYPYARRYWLGGELSYDFDRTLFGGIKNMNTTTSFSFHDFNLRALGGYDLQNKYGMVAFARLGFHYDSFQVSDVADFTKNTARIPNQIIQGPTLGAGLAIPRLTRTLGLEASLDVMLLGASVQQTKNLEDGTGPGAKALYLGGVLNYRWKPRMEIQGILDLGYTSVSFSGAVPATSMRGHTGTMSSGSDLNVAASVGIAYAL